MAKKKVAKVVRRIRKSKKKVCYDRPVRVSRSMRKLINEIMAYHILKYGKRPSISKITDIIANKVNKEDIIRNEMYRF